jgi:hypothetical protein
MYAVMIYQPLPDNISFPFTHANYISLSGFQFDRASELYFSIRQYA